MNSSYNFRDLDQIPVKEKEVIESVIEKYNDGYTIAVGCDSQMFCDNVSFVTTVCAHHRSKGANGFYVKIKIPRKNFPTLKARISAEAFSSLEMAYWVKEILPKGAELEVHLDIGNDPKRCATFKFKKELTTLIKSQGFLCKIKPESWASSGVADWFTKS